LENAITAGQATIIPANFLPKEMDICKKNVAAKFQLGSLNHLQIMECHHFWLNCDTSNFLNNQKDDEDD
jgi:hypothetical protein